MESKNIRLGNYQAVFINDVSIKSNIIDFIFNSVDLSKFRYSMLNNLQKLNYLQKKPHYVAPNFKGFNYLIVFTLINNNKYCVAIEKKSLSYHKNQINPSKVVMYRVLINSNNSIFKGSIFDCKLISKLEKRNDKKNLKFYMLIKDCFYLMGNQILDMEMKQKMKHLNNILDNNLGPNCCKNFIFKVNKLWEYNKLPELIYKIIPESTLRCQGLMFYPHYSGVFTVYLENKNKKIDITNTNNENVESKSLDLITNYTEMLKSRTYSYEKEGKTKKLWLKKTNIPDVFYIYEDLNDKKIGIAHIPNLKISHLCQEIFKEFNTAQFLCRYNKNFNKWIPVKFQN